MSTEIVVKVNNLHKTFGKIKAVTGLSFEIPKAQVMGFIGANGSGKTTAMRIMATLEAPTYGSVEIMGLDVEQWPISVRTKIGWMPDNFSRPAGTTVSDYLDFYARAYGCRGKEIAQRVGGVVEFTDLGPLLDKDISTLSKGMAQRLCLGRMLIGEPEVLIMDEPAAGLDPKARVELRRLIRLLAEDGRTIFLSSHILSELEDVCDGVLFINEGKEIHQGSLSDLKKSESQQTVIDVTFGGESESLSEKLTTWAESVEIEGIELLDVVGSRAVIGITSEEEDTQAEVLASLISSSFKISNFNCRERRLEEAFIEIVSREEREGN